MTGYESDARARIEALKQDGAASAERRASLGYFALAEALLTCATRLAAEYGRGDDGEALADRLLGEAEGPKESSPHG